jgi:hypothetical protein
MGLLQILNERWRQFFSWKGLPHTINDRPYPIVILMRLFRGCLFLASSGEVFRSTLGLEREVVLDWSALARLPTVTAFSWFVFGFGRLVGGACSLQIRGRFPQRAGVIPVILFPLGFLREILCRRQRCVFRRRRGLGWGEGFVGHSNSSLLS